VLFRSILTTTKPIFKVFKQANFIPPVTSQSTMREPGRTLYGKLEALNDNLISADMAFGFAPADIPNCGISLFVCGTDKNEAEKTAQFMLDEIHSSESLFDDHLIDGDQAILKAHELSNSANKPIIIADPQDNPGAGASGDSTGLISKLISHKIPALVGMFWDPNAAEACHKAGVDQEITLDIGGRFPKENGP
jgi:microcystin degradation protein MlrC